MENIENILVSLTVTKDSKNILDHAISIAEKFNAKIVVFHVLREPKMDLSEINYESGFLQKIKKQQEEEVERELRSLIPEEYYEKYNLSTEMTSGQPFLEIVNKAKSLNADLIVMGTHGRSGLSHVL
ncbi:MAG TPA: universal stress protein [Nitrospinota bacterium]|nr:universal stress protein [Nitrospinota bacterium]